MAKKIFRSDASYVLAAKSLANVAPSLAKYKRRKKLKPAEKAAISRMERKINDITYKANDGKGLIPVSKSQAKRLPKSALIGGGIRALIPQNFLGSNQKISFAGGKLSMMAAEGRRYYFVPVKNRDNLKPTAEKIFDTYPKRKIQINLWTVSGEGKQGVRSKMALDQVGWGENIYGDFNPILGLAYYFPK